jgi:hypothetical protein
VRRKSFIILCLALALVVAQSCKSHPETNLLTKYFNAISMNDTTTMGTIAVDPIKIDAASWKVVSVSEEKIEPAALAEIGAKEAEFKKQQDAHVPTTLDAKDTLDNAKDDYTTARTAAAKGAAKAKMDAAQARYDQEYAAHQDIIRQYNEAKAGAAKEEEITLFSLGTGPLANVRDLKGTVHTKDVQIEVKSKAGAVTNYKISMKMYQLKDEAANVNHRGRWVITKIEQI